jgi:hypothetical protein
MGNKNRLVDGNMMRSFENINVIELIKKELLIFRKYQLDIKDIKCPLQWW